MSLLFSRTKLLVAIISTGLLAACSSTATPPSSSNVADPSFTNAAVVPDSFDRRLFEGYSANELRNTANTVYFSFNSYQPKAADIKLIKAQAEFIMQTGSKVLLQGYADERGTPEYNITLGAERAKAVADLLISYGVNPSDIRQLSYGESRPAVLGHSEVSYAKNRRVVFYYVF